MIKRRKFRADYIRIGDETGVGITEHTGYDSGENWEARVIAIHSIYIDRYISNQDAQVNIFQFIRNSLEDNERAIVQMYQFSKQKGYHVPYQNRLHVRAIERYRGRLFHTSLLAQDAIKRKTSISEHFDEPMIFSIVKQEREERKQSGKGNNSNGNKDDHIADVKSNTTSTEY